VRLLLERGADPTIGSFERKTPLVAASENGHVETVRLLLGHSSGKATIDHRSVRGETALWWACFAGRGEVVRVLLQSGADPTTAHKDGTTPVAIAKRRFHVCEGAAGRRQCVAALEVRACFHPPPAP
jgi:ankyrin repeat protein